MARPAAALKESVISAGIARLRRALVRSVAGMNSSTPAEDTESGEAATPVPPRIDGDGPDRIEVARVALQFRLGRAAYVASPVYAMLMLVLLWRPSWEAALVGWFAVLLGVSLARAGVHLAYVRAQGHPWRDWERRFALGAFAAGVAWAAAPVLFFAAEDPLLQLAVMFVVGGSIVGATGLYAPSTLALYAYVLPPLIAMGGQLAAQGGSTYGVLAFAIGMLAAVLVRVHHDLRQSVVDGLRLREENAQLVRRAEASEAWMRDAIESIPDGVAVFDEGDRLLACNAAWATLYGEGRAPDALTGLTYREFASAAFDAEARAGQFAGRREAWVEARLAERQRAEGELVQMRARDGRWLQRRDLRSGRGGWLSLFTDVSALKGAHERYVNLLAEENAVLDTLPVGVAFVEHGRISRCNRRLELMLGHAPGALRDRTTRVWYASDAEWEERWRAVEAQLAAGGVVESELELTRADGSRLGCHLLGRLLEPGALQGVAILTFTDVDERLSALHALRRSEGMYRDLVETSNDLIWSMDLEGRWTYLNAAAVRRIYGCDPGDLLGRPFAEVLAPAVRERDLAVFRRLLEGEPVFNYETRHVRHDGSTVDLSFNAIALRDARGAVVGTTGTARDVTEHRRAAAALYETVEKLRLAVEVADLYYWEWDAVTDALSFGHTPGALVGSAGGRVMQGEDYVQRVHPEDRDRFLAARSATLGRGEAFICEYRVIGEGAVTRWFAARGRAAFDVAGRVSRGIGVSQDITDRKRSEEEARFLAHHDSLTALPNRRLLDDRLKQALFLAQRRAARLAVLLVDLDGFKRVNDVLGHRAGDAVLREAAQRLAGCVRKADTLARQGGDEFVIVIPDLQNEADCQVVAEKILLALTPEFKVDGQTFRIGASIGISVYPDDAGDGETLLRNADVAMYRAKELGKNNYRFYAR